MVVGKRGQKRRHMADTHGRVPWEPAAGSEENNTS